MDLYNNMLVKPAIPLAAHTATATGTTIDRSGYEGVLVVAVVGDVTDGDHALALEHSDDGQEWEAAPTTTMQGELGTLDSTSEAGVVEVGYLGTARYVRVVSTVTGSPATGGVYGALVLLGGAFVSPVLREGA
ncbi:hypothetical protein [Nocardiopsis dassonvillei]|uniref:hypothetical protein n=1 Tax=Nocardiopsis dassonvillei TaxID=2014 RepID=UPI00362B2206